MGFFRLRAGSGLLSCTMGAILALHWGTLHQTVGTKDAAIAWLRSQQRFAVRAFVEKLACVGRHRFSLGEAANRAHKHRFKKNFAHSGFHLWIDEGKPASVVALVNVSGLALSGSNEMLAVFLSKSTFASVTPGTLSSAFLTVIGQTAQNIFCTSRVTVCKGPANRLKGNATAAPIRTKRFISDFIINKIVAPATVRKLGRAPGP
jgi:hypothetical protein